MSDSWGFIRKEDSGALYIPGYKSRTYVNYLTYRKFTRIGIEGAWPPGVTVYIGKNGRNMFEFIAYNSLAGKSVNMNPEMSKSIFSSDCLKSISYLTPNEGGSVIDIKNINGHVLGSVSRFSCFNIKLSNIKNSFIDTLVYTYANEIICSAVLPDQVKDLKSAMEIYNALDDYFFSSDTLSDNFYEDEKKKLLEKINRKNDTIRKLQDKIDNICYDSADALNILSTKYGIEVPID